MRGEKRKRASWPKLGKIADSSSWLKWKLEAVKVLSLVKIKTADW